MNRVHPRLDFAALADRLFILRGHPIADLDKLRIMRRQGIDSFPLDLKDGETAFEVR